MQHDDRDRTMYEMYVNDNMTQLEIGDKYDMQKQYVGIIIRKYAKENNLPLPVRNNWKGRKHKSKYRSAGEVISELAQMPNAPIILSKPTDSVRVLDNESYPQYNGLPHHSKREVSTRVCTIKVLDGDYLRTGLRNLYMPAGLAHNVHKFFRVGNIVSLEYWTDTNTVKSISLVREGGYDGVT